MHEVWFNRFPGRSDFSFDLQILTSFLVFTILVYLATTAKITFFGGKGANCGSIIPINESLQ